MQGTVLSLFGAALAAGLAELLLPNEQAGTAKLFRFLISLVVLLLILSPFIGFLQSGEELLELANNMMLDFYANQVELKDGVREFLEYLSAQGTKMCIASATMPDLLAVAMKHCDLEKYFSKVFSCGAIGKGKEHPDVFLLAKDYFGASLEEAWVFEDSLVAIETATKVGFKTVGIYDRFNFGQDRIREIATEYVAPGETLLKLIK